jgi:hypothetical protein
MTSITSIVIAFITGVIGPILVIYIKSRLDNAKPKPDIVLDALKVGEQITNKIETIREDFKADRVWIIQFHNGGHFYPTGKSIAKFSMLYETVSIGANSIQTSFQNIPVNLFSKSINHLLENDAIEIPDFKDDKIATYGLKYVAEESGCKSGYLFSIKNIDDKFIGIMGIDYTKKKSKLDVEDCSQLRIHANIIGGALMNHLNK